MWVTGKLMFGDGTKFEVADVSKLNVIDVAHESNENSFMDKVLYRIKYADEATITAATCEINKIVFNMVCYHMPNNWRKMHGYPLKRKARKRKKR